MSWGRLWQVWGALMAITWIAVVVLIWFAIQGLAGAIVLAGIIERALNGGA